MRTTFLTKKCISETILFFIFFSGIAQAHSTHVSDTTKPKLEKGYPVKLVLIRDIGSSVAQAGNKVYFEVDSAILLSGITVVPKGSKAYGTISIVREAAKFAQKGSMAFTIDKIVMDNGRTILLTADYQAAGRNRAAQMIVGTVLISGLFIFTKGKNVTYKEGDKFVAYVLQDYQF